MARRREYSARLESGGSSMEKTKRSSKWNVKNRQTKPEESHSETRLRRVICFLKFHCLACAKLLKLFDTTKLVWLPKLGQNSAILRFFSRNWVPVDPAFFVHEVSHEVQAGGCICCDFQFPDGFRPADCAPREFGLRHVEIGSRQSDRHEIRVQQSSYPDLLRCHG